MATITSAALGNGAGAVGFSSLDSSLFGTPAKLHQAAIGQAADRDAPGHSRIDNRPGGGPQAHVLVQLVQLGNGPFQIKTCALNGGLAKLLGQFEGGLVRPARRGLIPRPRAALRRPGRRR